MSTFRAIWECMFSPRLLKVYGNGPVERIYESSSLEKWGDQVLHSLYMIWKLGIYTSPFLVGILYRKGYFMSDGLITLTKFVTSLGVILVISFCVRGMGRSSNPLYLKFVKALQNARCNLNPLTKQQLALYDFEFYAWPVDYKWNDDGDPTKHRLESNKTLTQQNRLQLLTALPCNMIGYLAVHTFGIRLIYPGSLGLLQIILAQSLLQGRTKLIEVNGGMRYKLLAKDQNEIDAMVIDKRKLTMNGNTLVVCCEGNAGFYEIGITCTPIEAGYSVLGWNHPGFGGSTGTPYPEQEKNAMDIVMQFAINKLAFKVENIIIFGWSIGGYTGTWAAMSYPNIKGLILDASFDDIMPLAINHMPRMFESIVRLAIREHVNLNNNEQLAKYPGPVLLIRRTHDEVICTTESDLSTNRGNNLLVKMLCNRYPLILGQQQIKLLHEYLAASTSGQEHIIQGVALNNDLCRSFFESYISENAKSYPMEIGVDLTDKVKNQMTIFLVTKYMKDYKSSHCTPLSTDLFQVPWDINVETDYVFT